MAPRSTQRFAAHQLDPAQMVTSGQDMSPVQNTDDSIKALAHLMGRQFAREMLMNMGHPRPVGGRKTHATDDGSTQ